MGSEGMTTIATGLKRLMWFGVAASWSVLGLYFYKFAPGHWFELSPDDVRWANFGTFYGGLLGPFISFLAFLGVIFTVVLQARQLDIARAQANFEEIQRTLSSLAVRIDGILAQSPMTKATAFQSLTVAPRSLFELISALGTMQLNKPAGSDVDWVRWVTTEDQMTRLRQVAASELAALGLEFETLAWCLNRYQERGGSADVIEFYQYRYRAVLCWMDSVGLLESHGQIQEFFRPKDSRKYMVGEPCRL